MDKLKIGELLSNGFEILVKNPILLALGVVTNLSLILVESKITTKSILGLIIWLLVSPYFIGLIVRFIYETREKKPSWQELSKFALRKYTPLLIIYIICYIVTFVGVVLFIIPGIFLSIKLIMCDYGIILENEGVIASLKRSWTITKGNWWRLLALSLVLYLPIIIFSFFESLFPKIIYILLNLLFVSCVFVWFQSTFTLAYLRLREIK
ncbi:MAG: hypothetical protein Q8O30_11010 [Candidatus Omnitrophota bacterium]|nr:hypothetical protein [Candidatus Omnitrophota bacterium]